MIVVRNVVCSTHSNQPYSDYHYKIEGLEMHFNLKGPTRSVPLQALADLTVALSGGHGPAVLSAPSLSALIKTALLVKFKAPLQRQENSAAFHFHISPSDSNKGGSRPKDPSSSKKAAVFLLPQSAASSHTGTRRKRCIKRSDQM